MRQAMMYAIDREAIVKAILQGEGSRQLDDLRAGLDGHARGAEPLHVRSGQGQATAQGRRLGQRARSFSSCYTAGDPENETPHRRSSSSNSRMSASTSRSSQVDAAELIRRLCRRRPTSISSTTAAASSGATRTSPASTWRPANFTPVGGNFGHYTNPQVDDLFNQGQARRPIRPSGRRSTPRSRRS